MDSRQNSQSDEIMKFKDLLDKGAITQEEYDKKKNEILNFNNKNTKIINQSKNNKKFNPFIGCLSVLLFSFLFIGGCTALISHIEKSSKNYDKISPDINIVLEKIGLKKLEYTIEQDSVFDNQEGDNTTGYWVAPLGYWETSLSERGKAVLYLNKDKSVNSVKHGDKYYYKNGKVMNMISDDIISTDDAYTYIQGAKDAVNTILKSPATAQFAPTLQWKLDKNNKIVIIRGYVDSQNSFSAIVRSNFKIIYNEEKDKYESFIFDGVDYIK